MVNSCCIKTCPTIAGQELKLHKFPKDLELRSKWLQFIQSIDKFFELKPSHVVCESHFCENDYTIPITSMNNNKKLKKDAVPSIIGILCISSRRSLFFENTMDTINDEMKEEVVPLLSEMLVDEISLDTVFDNELVSETTVVSKPLTTPPSQFTHFTPRKRKVYVGDFESPSDIETPNSRLKYWHASQSLILEQKKKLKKLTKDNEKLRNKIKNLSSFVEHLNDKKK